MSWAVNEIHSKSREQLRVKVYLYELKNVLKKNIFVFMSYTIHLALKAWNIKTFHNKPLAPIEKKSLIQRYHPFLPSLVFGLVQSLSHFCARERKTPAVPNIVNKTVI